MSHIDVLYEDNHLLAVNKPSGMLVQGDKTGDAPISELAKQYLIGWNPPTSYRGFTNIITMKGPKHLSLHKL